MNEYDEILIESKADLRDWLFNNYEQKESVWLIKWKKDSGNPYVSYDDIVDELICFGWVDSLPRKLDEKKSMLLISPRNPKSNWSAVNKKRVEKLIEEERMMASGLKLVALAKKNGAWDFLNDVE